jgi:hypothetical protein
MSFEQLKSNALEQATNRKVFNLVSFGKDAKTIKGEKYGVRTGIVYMAPADISDYEVCPGRTKGCTAACLFTAGQGVYENVKQGRLRRTYTYVLRRDEFMTQMLREIDREYNKLPEGWILAIRLNGTSDIAYEDIPIRDIGGEYYHSIFAARPNVQFYDYTKRFNRLVAINGIKNYHVTFSRAETKANQLSAKAALRMGVNVTVVFRKDLPEEYMGYPVIDGDETDIRFWDRESGPVIVGLKAKGKARYDTSGFVVD